MILADTSIWVEHLRSGHSILARLLDAGVVLAHPWVLGELALANLTGRDEVVGLLGNLPQATVATPHEVLAFVDHHQVYGLGIGYVDAQLVAAVLLTAGARLWSADKRLMAVASRLACAVDPAGVPAPLGPRRRRQ